MEDADTLVQPHSSFLARLAGRATSYVSFLPQEPKLLGHSGPTPPNGTELGTAPNRNGIGVGTTTRLRTPSSSSDDTAAEAAVVIVARDGERVTASGAR
jgi:hypothetical protein